MVEVRAETDSSCSKPERFFEAFDIICATCCSLPELLRLDDICRRHRIAFFAGDVFGYFGYMFADLHEHEYAEEIVTHAKPDSHSNVSSATGEPPAKKLCVEDAGKKTIKKVSSFAQLRDVINIDWSLNDNSPKLRKTPKTYFIIRVLLEFRTREGRDPDSDHIDSDAEKLKEITVEVLKSLGVSEDFLDLDFTAHCVSALSPVCAITGGILAQEVIKAVSQHDAPHNNFFFYNGLETSGMVDRIG